MRLRELADTLGARDLEKVTAFAEFVKARRAARGFAHRSESSSSTDSEPPVDSTSEVAAPAIDPDKDADDEEATPSSRKRPAAR